MSPYLLALGLMIAAATIAAVGAIYYATHHELSLRRWQRAVDRQRAEQVIQAHTCQPSRQPSDDLPAP